MKVKTCLQENLESRLKLQKSKQNNQKKVLSRLKKRNNYGMS